MARRIIADSCAATLDSPPIAVLSPSRGRWAGAAVQEAHSSFARTSPIWQANGKLLRAAGRGGGRSASALCVSGRAGRIGALVTHLAVQHTGRSATQAHTAGAPLPIAPAPARHFGRRRFGRRRLPTHQYLGQSSLRKHPVHITLHTVCARAIHLHARAQHSRSYTHTHSSLAKTTTTATDTVHTTAGRQDRSCGAARQPPAIPVDASPIAHLTQSQEPRSH